MRLVENFLSAQEHDALVEMVMPQLSKKRYEEDHWDSVIVNYRECELKNDHQAIQRARDALGDLGYTNLLPVHVVDLREDGRIEGHVDSVKFSGGVVAGLSLVSPATMTLTHEDHSIDVDLEPCSFYVLTGSARYDYSHSIKTTGRRISLILRDVKC